MTGADSQGGSGEKQQRRAKLVLNGMIKGRAMSTVCQTYHLCEVMNEHFCLLKPSEGGDTKLCPPPLQMRSVGSAPLIAAAREDMRKSLP